MPTLEERLAALQASSVQNLEARLEAAEGPQTSAPAAFTNEAVRTFLNNAMALPRGTGNLLALGSAGVRAGAAKLRGRPAQFGQRFSEEQQKFPAAALRAVPAPTVEDLGAGISSLPALAPRGESFRERFDEQRTRIGAEQAQARRANPFAAAAGKIAGDVFTLIGLRAPAAKGINRLEARLLPKSPDLLFGGAAPGVAESNLRFLLNRTITSPPVRKLVRGGGRSAEAGFEAMVLDVLKNDDPLETAAFAAAGQAGGSLFLEVGKGLLSGGPVKAGVKLGMSALAVGSLWQIMRTVTPGGRDSVISSIETGYDKVALGLALGAIAGLAGAGRFRGGQWAERFPKSMDALSTIPRGSMISMLETWRDASDDSKQKAEAIIGKLIEDPEFFGVQAAQRLQESFEQGSLFTEIDALMEDEDFSQRVSQLGE